MTVDALDLYLGDHWAGAGGGASLARHLADTAEGSSWHDELVRFADDVAEDEDTLDRIRGLLDSSSGAAKRTAAMAVERVRLLSPLPNLLGGSSYRRLRELEAMISGVTAKRCLWVSLQQAERVELREIDLTELERRADQQLELLRRHHAAVAADAFESERAATDGPRPVPG